MPHSEEMIKARQNTTLIHTQLAFAFALTIFVGEGLPYTTFVTN